MLSNNVNEIIKGIDIIANTLQRPFKTNESELGTKDD